MRETVWDGQGAPGRAGKSRGRTGCSGTGRALSVGRGRSGTGGVFWDGEGRPMPSPGPGARRLRVRREQTCSQCATHSSPRQLTERRHVPGTRGPPTARARPMEHRQSQRQWQPRQLTTSATAVSVTSHQNHSGSVYESATEQCKTKSVTSQQNHNSVSDQRQQNHNRISG